MEIQTDPVPIYEVGNHPNSANEHSSTCRFLLYAPAVDKFRIAKLRVFARGIDR